MAKALLVIPPCAFLLDERVFPTLGVLKVAAAMQRADIDVDVVDCTGTIDPDRRFFDAVLDADADWVGFTGTMAEMPWVARMAEEVRALRPAARIVLGGPHVTLLASSAKREQVPGRATRALGQFKDHFDTLVLGDGERAVLRTLTRLPPAEVIDADDPKSPLYLKPESLTDAPWPDRDKIDIASYHYAIDGHKTMSLIGQLGCPFGCTFCGGRNSPFLRRVRVRSPERIVAEVEYLYARYAATGFFFLDDELNVNRLFPELLAELVKLQERLGVDLAFRGLLKSELLTAEMATQMQAAGFRSVLVGFESGHPRILRNINKQATVDDNTRCVERLQAAGLSVKALMSLGHAGESEETIAATRRWLLSVRPDDFDATVLTVYPGTPIYDEAQPTATPGVYNYKAPGTNDMLYSRDVDQFTETPFYKGRPTAYQSFVWTEHLSAKDLVEARDDLEREVRSALKIPYPVDPVAQQYEHSMGLR